MELCNEVWNFALQPGIEHKLCIVIWNTVHVNLEWNNNMECRSNLAVVLYHQSPSRASTAALPTV